jgi:5-methylcytosine-specific restriction endonuclease McrA
MEIITEKKCVMCGETKRMIEFNKDKNRKDGYSPYCKLCTKLLRQRYFDQRKIYKAEYNSKHKEQNRVSHREWQRNHPENCKRDRNKQYIKNKDLRIEQAAQWTKNNPEKRKEISRRSYKKHPETHWNRRKREYNLPGSGITPKEWEELKSKYDHKCVYCGKETKLTLDHIVPVTADGPNDISNVVPACKSCNSSKNNMPLKTFLNRLENKGILQERTISIFQELGWSV